MDTWQGVFLYGMSTYLTVGIVLNFIIFLIAKIKAIDVRMSEWHNVLNSVLGFLFFLVIGSILWIPAIVSTLFERVKTKHEDPEPSWWWRIKSPYRLFKTKMKQLHQRKQ